jgi:hypothetical protein
VTPELGPFKPDSSQPAVFQWVGSRAAGACIHVLDAITRLNDSTPRISVDHERQEIVLRGESEHAGDAFARGFALGGLEALAMVWSLVGVIFFTLAAVGDVAPVVMLLLALGCGLSAFTIPGSLATYSVVDLTTEPPDDRLDDLAERFLAGEIDETELEEEADKVVEYEAGETSASAGD